MTEHYWVLGQGGDEGVIDLIGRRKEDHRVLKGRSNAKWRRSIEGSERETEEREGNRKYVLWSTFPGYCSVFIGTYGEKWRKLVVSRCIVGRREAETTREVQ